MKWWGKLSELEHRFENPKEDDMDFEEIQEVIKDEEQEEKCLKQEIN